MSKKPTKTTKTGRLLHVVQEALERNPSDPHLREVVAGTDVLDEHTQDALEAMATPKPEGDALAALIAQIEAPKAPAPKTVVKVAYKHRYQDRAKAEGRTDKASRRGNGDWLQRELQAETVGKDGKLDFGRFVAILDANGVDYSRWKREGHGWEGRFRMSGSLVLRGIVGKTATFRTPEGTVNVAKIADEGDENARAFLAKWAN